MQIYGFNKTTLLDYPKHLAATIFLGGCNFRCPFCHNASLVTKLYSQPTIPVEEVFSYLQKRKKILEGVCITGGEPTLYAELPDFIKDIKSLGLKVKLDTNGSNPSMLESLVQNSLIDYVAMDIKNSKEHYGFSVGVPNYDVTPICESVSYLLTDPVDYEFRTTIVQEHHNEQDIHSIGEWIRGAKAYYLQSYQDSGDVITPGLNSHTIETLQTFTKVLTPYVQQVSLRGIS
ncbi:MAG: hypothetical protein K0S47_676 [Herbinix sp.]|jgi:pyruvate formate lyase activating enzyme|nr:hypothetical protein [Herbinix sp.]